jgi:hypothetical protein
MDVATLPAQTLSTVGTVGGDILGGHIGKAISTFVDPYIHAIEHPIQALSQHPVATGLMFAPFLHVPVRGAGAAAATFAPESALGRLAGTAREGVQLTGKLTAERPAFSPYPTIKAGQVAKQTATYGRNAAGELVPRSPWLRDRLINQGVGELVGTADRIRVANRAAVRNQRESAVRPSRSARAAHVARTTFTYDPKQAVIPGAEVLSRIADTTVRRPDTIRQDLLQHAEQVSANRPNLLGNSEDLAAHDAYVQTIREAANNQKFLSNPGPAFKAAAQYATDYAPVQARAHALGHYGDMTAEALQRRELFHYAQMHMGARMAEDPVKVAAYERAVQRMPIDHPDWTFGQQQAALARVRPQEELVVDRPVTRAGRPAITGAARGAPARTVAMKTVPLSTQEILDHIKGPEGTGGRMPAFTSDRVQFDRALAARRAAYRGERRPMPALKRNTLYAYTHGLTDPGHEGLTNQHMEMQSIVDAHLANNNYAETLSLSKPNGSYWGTYQAAKRDAPPGYEPINLSQPFHPADSLEKAMRGVDPTTIQDEALRHSFDLSDRMREGPGNRWGLIESHTARALRNVQNQISPDPTIRTLRGLNNQFRTVALATNPKHFLGVAQENLIRDIMNGVGFRSWLTGRRMLARGEQLDAEKGANARTALTGGQQVGMTQQGKTYLVSDHWAGTNVYPFLKGFEKAAKAPGPRQLRTVWKAWTNFSLGATKHLLEQQHQIAGLGKTALREHGYADAARIDGFMGLAKRAMGLHGQLLDDAARGLHDPAKVRQFRASINRLYGKWTDFSPGAKTVLMFSPFGLWWMNSAKFLARLPVDQPVITGALAAATLGTAKQRQARGQDLFAPNALPSYMQGGIWAGNKVIAQNYYSPFGIANDPLATAQSLIQPWMTPLALAAAPSGGLNWLGRPLMGPGGKATGTQRYQYILDSVLSSFLPLYMKAKQVAEGGASAYDVSPGGIIPPLLRGQAPATKAPGKGPLQGLEKALQPWRAYKVPSGGGGGGGGGGFMGPSFGGGGGGFMGPSFGG